MSSWNHLSPSKSINLRQDLHDRPQLARPAFASPNEISTGGATNCPLSYEYNRKRHAQAAPANALGGKKRATNRKWSVEAALSAEDGEEGGNSYDRNIAAAQVAYKNEAANIETQLDSICTNSQIDSATKKAIQELLQNGITNSNVFHAAQNKNIMQDANKRRFNDKRHPFAGEADEDVAPMVIHFVLGALKKEMDVLKDVADDYFSDINSGEATDEKLFDSLAPQLNLYIPNTVRLICTITGVTVEQACRDYSHMDQLPKEAAKFRRGFINHLSTVRINSQKGMAEYASFHGKAIAGNFLFGSFL
jgi:hypothetical protein